MSPWPFRRRPEPSRASARTPSGDRPPPDPVEAALGYHQRTKHHPQRFARSLGFLDWDQQPAPFRRFEGAPTVGLPLPPRPQPVPYAALFEAGRVAPRPVDRDSLSSFFFHGLALSAWKRFEGNRWSLRVDPSSGNLHPTEGWLVAPASAGLTATAAVLHYAPEEHLLEQRATLSDDDWRALTAPLPAGALLVGLSSVVWREAWKYGERAWRYCQHDVGHALGALRLAAALQGWGLAVLPDLPDDTIAGLLGLDRDDACHDGEREAPDLLAVLTTDGRPAELRSLALPPTPLPGQRFSGQANRLSEEHHDWPILDVIEGACLRGVHAPPAGGPAAGPTSATSDSPVSGPASAPPSATAPATSNAPPAAPASATGNSPAEDADHAVTPDSAPDDAPRGPAASLPDDDRDAGALIRRRRSAVAMDGTSSMARDDFFALLRRLVPQLSPVPFDALSRPAATQLALFVHRVDDLPPGLYLLARAPLLADDLRAALRRDFVHHQPPGCPADLPLTLLHPTDARSSAAAVSCSQDIAGAGVFSLGMLCPLSSTLARRGASAYRDLYWEAGLIGQVLYLQAEAAQLSGTGIGCYFDDQVHQLLGLKDLAWQSLYHFALGGRVDDPRLQDEQAYPFSRD